MKFPLHRAALAAAALSAALAAGNALAIGGPSGARVTFPVQGHIGEVVWNQHKIAPLTAVIRNGGYDLNFRVAMTLDSPGGLFSS